MKKFLIIGILSLCAHISNAQEIQIHHDFGSLIYSDEMNNRPSTLIRFDMSKNDKWGNTYIVVKSTVKSEGFNSTFFKIQREFGIMESPFLLHLQYNGGLSNKSSYDNAFLIGGTYKISGNSKDKLLKVSLLYKNTYGKESPNKHTYQIFLFWKYNFMDGLLTFKGYGNLWREQTDFGNFKMQLEPQFWVNLNKLKCIDDNFNLSLGTQVDLLYDMNIDGFYAIPTLGLKWTF